MTYPIGTTLIRKQPLSDDDPQAASNRIKVVAVSPLSTPNVGEWADAAPGDTFVCTPVDVFGGNEPIPLPVLQRDYKVESMPEEPLPVEAQRQVRPTRAETPEEAFQRMAREKEAAAVEAARAAEQAKVAAAPPAKPAKAKP